MNDVLTAPVVRHGAVEWDRLREGLGVEYMADRRTLASEILSRARDIAASGWTQGALARDERGRATEAYDVRAVCWCVEGAVTRASIDLFERGGVANEKIILAYSDALDRLSDAAGELVHFWNDEPDRRVEEALALFEGALRE